MQKVCRQACSWVHERPLYVSMQMEQAKVCAWNSELVREALYVANLFASVPWQVDVGTSCSMPDCGRARCSSSMMI